MHISAEKSLCWFKRFHFYELITASLSSLSLPSLPVSASDLRLWSGSIPGASPQQSLGGFLLKCGTQQAALLPCGAGTVSTKRSRWACGGVGNLACESPTERKRRAKSKALQNLCASTHNSFTQLRSINVRGEVVCPSVGPSGRKH